MVLNKRYHTRNIPTHTDKDCNDVEPDVIKDVQVEDCESESEFEGNENAVKFENSQFQPKQTSIVSLRFRSPPRLRRPEYMAHLYGDKDSWHDDEGRNYSSGLDSDESPILSHRYDRYRRFAPYVSEAKTEERRKSTFTYLAKFLLISTGMILFCVLMYIPVYNKANNQMSKDTRFIIVDALSHEDLTEQDRVVRPQLTWFERLKKISGISGWSVNTNRDTKIYVQPNNVTTIHEPKDVCPKDDRNKKNHLFLLIIVCSSTTNFDRRKAIRETWGDYKTYLKLSKINNAIRNKYKDYNFTHDLYNETDNMVGSVNYTSKRKRRNISGFGQLLPELAKALQKNMETIKTDDVPVTPEKRFANEEEDDNEMLDEFDMNKELGDSPEEEAQNYDYEYESNIMRIPPKGYEESPNLEKVLNLLKLAKPFLNKESMQDENPMPDFKLLFLLGLPSEGNVTDVQDKIEEEAAMYGDIIQEGFIDSYNNLTLKSIMMLKWITYNCNESVRYILKTDDDMYVNVPNLVRNLRNRSQHFDNDHGGYKRTEYLLIGGLICGARPVHNSHDKWYSPRYMYGGRVYPRYLSGTGYVMSAHAAHALYEAALRTNYFHLEDVYITGMCAYRARPRLTPRDEPLFSYRATPARAHLACCAHARATAHRVPPARMRALHTQLLLPDVQDLCERKRLTQVRQDRLKRQEMLKKFQKIAIKKAQEAKAT